MITFTKGKVSVSILADIKNELYYHFSNFVKVHLRRLCNKYIQFQIQWILNELT